MRELGEGAFGTVSLAVHKHSGIQFAIKFVDNSLQKPQDLEECVRETETQQRVVSEYVAKVHHWKVCSDKFLLVVMEVAAGGELFDVLVNKDKAAAIDEAQRWEWIWQLLQGIANCHERGVAHLDLKAQVR